MVPEPPKERITIPQKDPIRVEGWVAFFKNLSPRVRLALPAQENFEKFLARIKKRVTDRAGDGYTINDWPKSEQIAFAIAINSAEPNEAKEKHDTGDVYIFCYGNIAFSLDQFEWDGDPDNENYATTYSLIRHYDENCLFWIYIKGLIVARVTELENRVPPIS